jgi:hypothetical protein
MNLKLTNIRYAFPCFYAGYFFKVFGLGGGGSHHVVKVCSDVLDKRTVSLFRVKILVGLNMEAAASSKVPL